MAPGADEERYVPPHLRRRLQLAASLGAPVGAREEGEVLAAGEGAAAAQRRAWETAVARMTGVMNKANAGNVADVLPELFTCGNLVRLRGPMCRTLMRGAAGAPEFVPVYASMVAVVNTKFPEVGELLAKRLVIAFRDAYRRHDKTLCTSTLKFVAHLVNQTVVHELLALEVVTLLLHTPSPDSVELAVSFIKEVGYHLKATSPRALLSVFDRVRAILQEEADLPQRVQYLMEGLFDVRKRDFAGYPSIRAELDLVEAEDQIVHDISLEDESLDAEEALDRFAYDPDYEEVERQYAELIEEILGGDDGGEGGGGGDGGGERAADAAAAAHGGDDGPVVVDAAEVAAAAAAGATGAAPPAPPGQTPIQDRTGTDLVALRRTIYLAIMSSIDFEEAGHKLLKLKIDTLEDQRELCVMIVECCSQEKSYLRYFGLLAQRFCEISRTYQALFADCFAKQYQLIHRLETNKLRNVGKLFAHLFASNALPWECLQAIRMTEDDTTSSSRIFCKVLFQELSELLGLKTLNQKLNDPAMQEAVSGIFPKDSMRNARFAINFFTSIGLGGVTDAMREWLKEAPAYFAAKAAAEAERAAKEEEHEREERAREAKARAREEGDRPASPSGSAGSGSYSYSYSYSGSYSGSGSYSYSYSYSGSDDDKAGGGSGDRRRPRRDDVEDDARSPERPAAGGGSKRGAPPPDDDRGDGAKRARRLYER